MCAELESRTGSDDPLNINNEEEFESEVESEESMDAKEW